MYACAGGHEEVAKALLEAGAKVEDHRLLREAASAGHVGMAKASLVLGSQPINHITNKY